MFERNKIKVYTKQVSKFIVDNIRGTEYGPEASFRDFTKAIVRNTNEVLSVSIPFELPTVSKSIFAGIPHPFRVEIRHFLLQYTYQRGTERDSGRGEENLKHTQPQLKA